MPYYAHSGRADDKSDWQGLKEHLEQVAALAGQMAEALGLGKAAMLAGRFHDLGKYTLDFQKRLTGTEISVDHSTAGAWHILQAVQGEDRFIAELIAYAILGHHAGLPDKRGSEAALTERIAGFKSALLDKAWRTEISADLSGLMPGFSWADTRERLAFQMAFCGRMLFSCLVDADFKDTEAYYSALEGRYPDRVWQPLQTLLPQFIAGFERHMADKKSKPSDLNTLRSEILAHVREMTREKPGLFTLTVPTGGGKTLASLAFALDHAQAHGHNRIIYAIPFTSIIDQTAAIFRDVLGDEHVLEHHSAIDEEKFDSRQGRESRDKLKLAMEDWAAPVVVTTNVQLFESLFAARTSRARKLHNIAGSIIILDEAQTIPRHLLSPAVRALDELARNYKCTIVLCTATQPALDERNFPPMHPAGLPLAGRELAPDPERLARQLRRVTIQRAGEMGNADLIAALEETPQGLVIVNSRKHALELFREAEAVGLTGLVHLTTRQYAAHRREILADIRQRLRGEAPCRVIATSLVEAGVDVDFPKVWRAEAGLDSIAQAAGRCNREGRRPVEASIVTVFSAPDYPPPSEIKGLIADTARMVDKHEDLLSPAAIAAYFEEVYWRVGIKGLDGKSILDRFRMDKTGTDFAYRSVAADFRMIESQMVPVIIARDEAAKKAVDELGIPEIPSGTLATKLQTYVVQVPLKARELMRENGHVAFIHPEIRGDQFAVLQTASMYEEEIGLLWENADYLSMESLLI
ncbi:CRISPR-associated helicase/endonuclease Cas3 [Metarhizobium album]|uniref:CRISPR-associated helicase/endonuclease Cas3 n=1 Tax=Metarhizobium album TaxID=2182425 RepID=A0A2U2DNS8_9HYPH|nr:CRISPR-associated helicase Cas3' [Rhizobium album]PWE54967.1 CRISPR-associated helicase/endonuclease Cas3 [Rhizobium album]